MCQEPWIHTDLQRRAENLMNYAAVMCDLHFSKKKPTSAGEYTHLAMCFEKVEYLQIKFCKLSQAGTCRQEIRLESIGLVSVTWP